MGMLNNEVIKIKKLKRSLCAATFFAIFLIKTVSGSEDQLRTMKYTIRSKKDAVEWQNKLRSQLSGILKMDEILPGRRNIPFDSREILTEKYDKYVLKEIEVIYKDFKEPENVQLRAHEGAHEIDLPTLLDFFSTRLKPVNR